jgi:hypothetical protein
MYKQPRQVGLLAASRKRAPREGRQKNATRPRGAVAGAQRAGPTPLPVRRARRRKWAAAAHLLQPADALGKPLGFCEVAGGNVLHLLQAQYLNLPIIVIVPKHGEIPLSVHFSFHLATFLGGVIDR